METRGKKSVLPRGRISRDSHATKLFTGPFRCDTLMPTTN